jgi:3-hydroxyisobutyrate dehydrogenase-like beta-hydroxyacid dehydrogenase
MLGDPSPLITTSPSSEGSAQPMATIGFVGLGAMGGRIATRLLAAGYPVRGTNRTAAKGTSLVVEHGLIWCDTPREAAEGADVVFSMVTDDEALEAVTAGPNGILAGLPAGSVYVDMSTVSPAKSREVAERVRAVGAEMLDAPVSGSLPAAEGGTLTIMVGGDEATFARVEPILQELGSVTRIGENGQALLMKLAVNISLAEQMLGFSEGVLLAEQGGIDGALAVDILTNSAVGSPMLKTRGSFVLDLPERALFDVDLMRKDLHLALEAAGALGVPVPSAAVAKQLFTAASAMGYADRDIAVVYEVLAEMAGQ